MNDPGPRNKKLIVIALGAGVFIGAGLFYLFYTFSQRKKFKFVLKDLARDLEKLRLCQRCSKLMRLKSDSVGSSKSKVESEDMFSALSMEDESDEYYDINSGDEVTESGKSRLCKKCSKSIRSKRDSVSSSLSKIKSDDMFSAINTEDESDEYYDINSDDEVILISENNAKIYETNKLFEEVDVLMKGNDEDRLNAFNLLKENEFEYLEDPDFLWRFAKAHQIQGAIQQEAENKKKYIFEGLEYAAKALDLDSTNADAHKWFAILTGMQTDFLSIKEKIQSGYLFQKHLLTALESKPNDYLLHYLLGRFKFEIANISWFERKIAASIFGEVPTATYSEAITHLMHAEELNPSPWKENKLLLAKCCIGDGRYDKAMEWLDSAKQITPRTKDDEACDKIIDDLIKNYQQHRKVDSVKKENR